MLAENLNIFALAVQAVKSDLGLNAEMVEIHISAVEATRYPH